MENSSSAEENRPRYTSALPLFFSKRQLSPERKNSWKKKLHKILDPHLLTRSRLLLLEAELADQDANRGVSLYDDAFTRMLAPEPGRGTPLTKKPWKQKLKILLLKLSKLNCFAPFRRGSQPQSPYPRQSGRPGQKKYSAGCAAGSGTSSFMGRESLFQGTRFSEEEQVKRIMARGLRPNLFRVSQIEEEEP
jgi:hypothetical protein